jgi:hypothetical protein
MTNLRDTLLRSGVADGKRAVVSNQDGEAPLPAVSANWIGR